MVHFQRKERQQMTELIPEQLPAVKEILGSQYKTLNGTTVNPIFYPFIKECYETSLQGATALLNYVPSRTVIDQVFDNLKLLTQKLNNGTPTTSLEVLPRDLYEIFKPYKQIIHKTSPLPATGSVAAEEYDKLYVKASRDLLRTLNQAYQLPFKKILITENLAEEEQKIINPKKSYIKWSKARRSTTEAVGGVAFLGGPVALWNLLSIQLPAPLPIAMLVVATAFLHPIPVIVGGYLLDKRKINKIETQFATQYETVIQPIQASMEAYLLTEKN